MCKIHQICLLHVLFETAIVFLAETENHLSMALTLLSFMQLMGLLHMVSNIQHYIS